MNQDANKKFLEGYSKPEPEKKEKKKKSVAGPLIVFLIIAIILVGAYLAWKKGLPSIFSSNTDDYAPLNLTQEQEEAYDFIAKQIMSEKTSVDDLSSSLSKDVVRYIKRKAGIVEFADTNLELAIRNQVDKTDGTLFQSDIQSITVLEAQGFSITNLDGLQLLKNLTEINFADNYISNVYEISKLEKLSILNLSNNKLSDIKPLKELKLRSLDLSSNFLSNCDSLSSMKTLQKLYLSGNLINNLSSLSDLTYLKELNVSDNDISKISGLNKLTSLETLILNDNQINDINAVSSLTSLSELNLEDNKIKDISALKSNKSIHILNLNDNLIEDIKPIKNSSFSKLSITRNPISDYSILDVMDVTELEK